ncbi:MAG: AAA family ATPase [Candidatus Marinimicrobia bacterium]|nr:AAA family ATPase [Candidatus Neomarinimicrobiota bacterium]
MTSVTRFYQPPKGSFFLFGPRGTGKSTWLKQNGGEALRIDLLDRESYRLFAARPERLRELVLAQATSTCIVLDEVQKIPELLDVVHQIMEDQPRHRFILTGSSARKLKRTGVDLLAGRAALTTMHPFMAAELGDAFNLDVALHTGLVPVIHSAVDRRAAQGAYLGLYLEQEVKAEALVREVGDFARFLEAISFSHASILNFTGVARECQVNRNTAQGYVEVLEDLLLAFRLPVFARRAKRHLAQHPKFYFFDAGVFRSVRPRGPLDAPEEMAGAALEGLVAQHLRAWIAYGNRPDIKLYYWRTKAGTEVDFVIYGEDTLCALEVKNARQVHRADVRALRAFQEDYPQAQTCLLHRGHERLLIDGVLCLPCEAFLRNLRPGSVLPYHPLGADKKKAKDREVVPD